MCTIIGLPYNLLVISPCTDIKLGIILQSCSPKSICPSLSLLFEIINGQPPVSVLPTHTHIFHIKYFVYHLTFSILSSLIIKIGVLQPNTVLIPSSHQSKGEFIHQRQGINLIPQCWDSIKDKDKAKTDLELHGRRFQSSPFIHSLNEIEDLLCVRYCNSSCISRSKQNSKNSCPHGAYLLVKKYREK